MKSNLSWKWDKPRRGLSNQFTFLFEFGNWNARTNKSLFWTKTSFPLLLQDGIFSLRSSKLHSIIRLQNALHWWMPAWVNMLHNPRFYSFAVVTQYSPFSMSRTKILIQNSNNQWENSGHEHEQCRIWPVPIVCSGSVHLWKMMPTKIHWGVCWSKWWVKMQRDKQKTDHKFEDRARKFFTAEEQEMQQPFRKKALFRSLAMLVESVTGNDRIRPPRQSFIDLIKRNW